MANFKVNADGTAIMQKLKDYLIDPIVFANGVTKFEYRGIKNKFVKIKDKSSQHAGGERPFLLADHNMSVRALSRLLVACRNGMISIGFDISHAQEFDKIFVVGDFSGDTLENHFVAHEIDVTYIAAKVFMPVTLAEIESLNNQGIHVAIIEGEPDGNTITACLKNLFGGVVNEPLVYFQ